MADSRTSKNKKQDYCVREYDKTKTFNEVVEEWYINNAPTVSKEALLDEAENLYGTKILKIEKALLKLKAKREEFLNAQSLKNAGDLLFSNLHLIKKGMKFIELEDYTKNGAKINIILEPLKTPQENANLYYEKYKKAVSGLDALEEDIISAEKEIEKLKEK